MGEQTLKFELSSEEANVVLAGLGELPAKHSLGLIQKLQTQAQGQLQVTEQTSGQQVLTEG